MFSGGEAAGKHKNFTDKTFAMQKPCQLPGWISILALSC